MDLIVSGSGANPKNRWNGKNLQVIGIIHKHLEEKEVILKAQYGLSHRPTLLLPFLSTARLLEVREGCQVRTDVLFCGGEGAV